MELFVHSYQSYLGNHATSIRVKKYGAHQIVLGDLVYYKDINSKDETKFLHLESKNVECNYIDDNDGDLGDITDAPELRSTSVKDVRMKLAFYTTLRNTVLAEDTDQLDNMDHTSSPDTKMDTTRVILQNPGQNSFSVQGEARAISKSVPLFPAKKFDLAERLTQLPPSGSHKFISYVLPTPDETKSPASRKFDNEASQTKGNFCCMDFSTV